MPPFASTAQNSSAQTQSNLPKPENFRRATAECKNKSELVAKVTGDRVGTSTKLVECKLLVHRTCSSDLREHSSGPRGVKANVCADFYVVARALNGMEICCDEKAPETQTSSQNQDCPQPAPWFDPSRSCKDLQATQLQVTGDTATVSVCGHNIFSYRDENLKDSVFAEAYRQALRDRLAFDGSSKICCDQLADAVNTGSPCDPSIDIDCDGTPNVNDGDGRFPNINPFQTLAGSNIDLFPPSFNSSDPDFRPERTARNSKGVGDCPCQWQLTGGELKCSADGRQRHYYKATWRCPTTGAEIFTVKYLSPASPCSKD
jgi:hypothetical protein